MRTFAAVVIFALAGTALLPAPAARAECQNWHVVSEALFFRQSNNINVGLSPMYQDGGAISGTASFMSLREASDWYCDIAACGREPFKVSGNMEGTIDGSRIDMRVYWENGQIGAYEGSITPTGRVEGTAEVLGIAGTRVTWFSDANAFICRDQVDAVIIPIPEADPVDPNSAGGVAEPGGFAPVDPSSPATEATDPGGIAEAMRPVITGTYDSSFGILILWENGGTYTTNDGRLLFQRVDGNVVEGIWQESRGVACADGQIWGRFRFEFTRTGFTGAYGNCEGELAREWNGTKRPA